VVEIGPFTAGPLAGRSLGDLGADVVKIEPLKGEVSRSWSPRAGHVSGYFANYNAGKRSAVLDLNGADGRQLLERLLSSADVLVANLKAGALEKLGFGANAVLQRHPRLVYCSISGYGQSGPQDAALDTVIQAESGIMSCVGLAQRPCKIGFSIADLIAGHLAPLAVLAALRARDRDGLGQLIDLSMLDALRWLMRMGAELPNNGEAFQVERHADGWVVSGTGGSRLRRTKVRDLGEVFSDPSLARRHMLLEIPTSGGQHARIVGSPYALQLTPPRPGAMIGEAGADIESVLSDWSSPTPTRGARA
jgi:crotonobetainyl-CoA:carnitine CoA-transferase CaiB-like acyl-CoA transferase